MNSDVAQKYIPTIQLPMVESEAHSDTLTQDTQASSLMARINLPTDENFANEGIIEFKKMIAYLPQDLGEKARNDEDLFKVYYGIFPELGGWSGSLLTRSTTTPEETAILIEAINSNGWLRVIRHAHRGFSLVNLKAAIRVIRNNSIYFPEEALLNPISWLINNPTQWYPGAIEGIEDIRYGLLSGFPLNACLKCVKCDQTHRRLRNRELPGETMEEAIFIHNFVMARKHTPEELAKFSEILRNRGRGLFTEDEISLWKQRHYVETEAYEGFIGFDESDDAWASAADELYRKIKTGSSVRRNTT